MFIREMEKAELFKMYKAIKKALLANDAFNFENLILALDSKLADVEELLKA